MTTKTTTISETSKAMRAVEKHSGHVHSGRGSKAWHDDTEIVAILTAAEKLGWVRRLSVTQVQWTEAGCALAEATRSPVESITVEQVEGEVGAMVNETVKTFEAADSLLRDIAFAHEGPGYRKTEVTIRWENGEKMTQRHDVKGGSIGNPELSDTQTAPHARRLIDCFIREELFSADMREAAKRIKATCDVVTEFERKLQTEGGYWTTALAEWS